MAVTVSNTACYTYRPAASEQLVPGTRVAFSLTDRARVDLSSQIGGGALRLDGMLMDPVGDSFRLNVTSVRLIQGGSSRWSGETVTMSRDHIASVSRRDFSRGRTALAIGVAAATVTAFVITRDLSVFGLGKNDRPPRPPPNNQ